MTVNGQQFKWSFARQDVREYSRSRATVVAIMGVWETLSSSEACSEILIPGFEFPSSVTWMTHLLGS